MDHERERVGGRRVVLYGAMALCATAATPWFFVDEWNVSIVGFPPWAFYSLLMTVVFALVVAIFIDRFWEVSAADAERDESS